MKSYPMVSWIQNETWWYEVLRKKVVWHTISLMPLKIKSWLPQNIHGLSNALFYLIIKAHIELPRQCFSFWEFSIFIRQSNPNLYKLQIITVSFDNLIFKLLYYKIINLHKNAYVICIWRNVYSARVLCIHRNVVVFVNETLNFFNRCEEITEPYVLNNLISSWCRLGHGWVLMLQQWFFLISLIIKIFICSSTIWLNTFGFLKYFSGWRITSISPHLLCSIE